MCLQKHGSMTGQALKFINGNFVCILGVENTLCLTKNADNKKYLI